MGINIQFRRGTAAEWTAANPTLLAGEVGFETDTLKLKVGTGSTAWTALSYYGAAPLPNRNAIINGSFAVAQRGAGPFTSTTLPINSDDTYLLDRWTLLSDGNDVVDVSQETSATITNPLYNIKLDVETANKKFGIVTILENKDSRRLANQTVSLSFKAKGTKVGGSLTVNAIRAVVLSWTSTADVVTSDVVSTWEAAGANPTWAANLTAENTPVALAALTESWQTYKIEGIAIDTAGATNVLVFIWADDVTMDLGDFLQIAEVQLEIGSAATPFEYKPYQQELALCQRFAWGLTTVVAAENIAFGIAASTTVAYVSIFLPVSMRATPTLSIATATDWKLYDGVNAATDVTALVIDDKTMSNFQLVTLKATVASGLTQYRSYWLTEDATISRLLVLSAEL